jgi:hydrogenase-4 component B
MTSTASLLETSVILLLAGSLVSLLLAKRCRSSGWASVIFVTFAAMALWAVVAKTFAKGPDAEVRLVALPEIRASLAVWVDQLSSLFLAIVGTISVLTTLFSVEYMTHYERDSAVKYYPVLLVFFAGIIGVVVTADFLFFLVFWELMTLASFFLVIFEREKRASQRAGLKYFIVTHAATFCMMAAALVLWKKSGSFHFSAMREALGSLLVEQPFVGHLVIFLFFMGFATKAGILPMGDWLPDAYPAAPSGATAAFGGCMTKLGIYGLLRVFLNFVPLSETTQVWGVIVVLAGVSSLFVGTLTALRQDDAKQLMSFHVIGQVGYMFLGIGLGLCFLKSNPVLGTLGLLAGVFHTLNHSLYKTCLFLGAGAIIYRTGSHSLKDTGGLGLAMPVTATCSLIAALAIAGVPPLNGFSSKWLVYVTAIMGGSNNPLFLIIGIVAMFISLVTLASFLKYLGGAFWGPPARHEGVSEVPASMLVPQILLAVICVIFGLVPLLPLRYVHIAVTGLMPEGVLHDLPLLLGNGPGLQVSMGGLGVAFWAPLAVLAGLAVAGLLSYGIQRAGGAEVRNVPVWYCGEEHEISDVRYPASSFYLPFKDAFHMIYPAWSVRYIFGKLYFIKTALHTIFPVWSVRVPQFLPKVRRVLEMDKWLYEPFAGLVQKAANGVSKTHVGTPQVYLLWMVIGAIVVVGIILAIAS